VLVGLAIAFGAHAPELSLAALGLLLLGWLAWSMIKRRTVAIMDVQPANTRPDRARPILLLRPSLEL